MDAIATFAERKPDADAIIEGERRLTWRGYREQRDRLAGALVGLGLRPGEHVILYAPNSLECLLASAATRAAGAIPVPMNHRLSPEEAAYILDDSDATLAFVGEPFVPLIDRIRDGVRGVRHWVTIGGASPAWATSSMLPPSTSTENQPPWAW